MFYYLFVFLQNLWNAQILEYAWAWANRLPKSNYSVERMNMWTNFIETTKNKNSGIVDTDHGELQGCSDVLPHAFDSFRTVRSKM